MTRITDYLAVPCPRCCALPGWACSGVQWRTHFSQAVRPHQARRYLASQSGALLATQTMMVIRKYELARLRAARSTASGSPQ